MVKMTGATAIAKTLREHGTEHVFYIFGYGVPTSELEAEGINMVLTRNEKCAAYIADGYARIGLRPGVAWGYRGPPSDSSIKVESQVRHVLRSGVAALSGAIC